MDKLESNGIPGLLSPAAFKTAYTDYMGFITSELNHLTAGKPYQNQEVKNLVIEFARDPQRAYEFNLASMAFNNHFFFSGINTQPEPSRPSAELQVRLIEHFSSMETLREEFLTTAEAMFGPGFVWLVQTNTQKASFRILPTYLAGSPLSGAHYRRQPVDQNTQHEPTNTAGSFGPNSSAQKGKPKRPLGGVDVTPLLCVNTWEHVWLQDYVPKHGFAGKRLYLEAWWDKINWSVAEQIATLDGQPKNRFER
jgi:Fe-Mn family superoxide dismutase